MLNPPLSTQPSNPPPGLAPEAVPALGDKYGLAALALLLRMQQNDQTSTALGSDLQLFGLDLMAPPQQQLLATFASPWMETLRTEVEPAFTLPPQYHFDSLQLQLPLPDQIMGSFTDETLFFIFYTQPRDLLQEMAFRELIARNWRYHKDLQVWLTKSSDVEPVQVTSGCERGVYVFFDPHNWVKIKKEFMLYYHTIM